MRIPVKINCQKLPSWVNKIMRGKYDPRQLINNNDNINFEKCVSALKIDDTWKTTSKNRHDKTDQKILELLCDKTNQSILEIGVSTGITSVELIKLLENKIKDYYATDIYCSIPVIKGKYNTYFYHPSEKKPIIAVNDKVIVYNDLNDTIFILKDIVKYIFNKAPQYSEKKAIWISMIHPELKRICKKNKHIHLLEYNIFDDWKGEKVNMVKIANVLNRTYFNDNTIKKAINNIRNVLLEDGYMVIIDNRNEEKSGIYKINKINKFEIIEIINGGCEIHNIIQ